MYVGAQSSAHMSITLSADGHCLQVPHLPVDVDALAVERLHFRGLELSITFDATFLNVSTGVSGVF